MSNNKLLIFLEDLIEKIKSDTIDHDKKLELLDFYIRYNSDIEPIDNDNDIIKYLCMGWYIYNQIENTKPSEPEN
jgi:hypothetical protein